MGHFDTRAMWGQATAFINADSNGGADITLIPALTAHVAVIDLLIYTADAAASFVLESDGSSDTVIFPTIYLGAGDQFIVEDPGIRGLVGEAVKPTIVVTGNCSVFVKYHYEPALGAYA